MCQLSMKTAQSDTTLPSAGWGWGWGKGVCVFVIVRLTGGVIETPG